MDEDEYWDYDDYEDEVEDVIEDEGCPCGYYCFECLGMSWSDFI